MKEAALLTIAKDYVSQRIDRYANTIERKALSRIKGLLTDTNRVARALRNAQRVIYENACLRYSADATVPSLNEIVHDFPPPTTDAARKSMALAIGEGRSLTLDARSYAEAIHSHFAETRACPLLSFRHVRLQPKDELPAIISGNLLSMQKHFGDITTYTEAVHEGTLPVHRYWHKPHYNPDWGESILVFSTPIPKAPFYPNGAARSLPIHKKFGPYYVAFILPSSHYRTTSGYFILIPHADHDLWVVSDSSKYFHPHVNPNGSPCLGNVTTSIPNLLEAGEWYAAYEVFKEAMTCYGADAPFITASAFLQHPEPGDCPICAKTEGRTKRQPCTVICLQCKERLCADQHNTTACTGCGRYLCDACQKTHLSTCPHGVKPPPTPKIPKKKRPVLRANINAPVPRSTPTRFDESSSTSHTSSTESF